jgi:ABC-2 type transport system permease protein
MVIYHLLFTIYHLPITIMFPLLWAFFKRDWQTELSYRVSFLLSLSSTFFGAFTFYFVAQLVGDVPLLRQYDGDYFSFVLIGIAFGSYFGLGLTGFARSLREAQTTGTLEAMIMTSAPLSLLVVGSAVWSYAFTTFRVFVYLGLGVGLLGVSLGNANYSGALAVLILSIVAFGSIGILAASVIMVIKRGDPITALFGTLANMIGGVYYPVEIMPEWLQGVASLLPITYALRAIRRALLAGADWTVLAPDLAVLLLFCVVLLPLSLLAFHYAVERARADGSLTHF